MMRFQPMLQLQLDFVDGCPGEEALGEGRLAGDVIFEADAKSPSFPGGIRVHIPANNPL